MRSPRWPSTARRAGCGSRSSASHGAIRSSPAVTTRCPAGSIPPSQRGADPVSILNPLADLVAWAIMHIHAGLGALFGPDTGLAWGLSIAVLVIIIRLLLVPLFVKQVHAQRKMAQHAPHLAELRKKYKNDKQKLNEETMKFYKENGVNPLAGCLPLLAQLPVFWALFNVLRAIANWTPGHTPSYGMTVPFVESAHSARIFGISLYDQFLHPAVGESSTS